MDEAQELRMPPSFAFFALRWDTTHPSQRAQSECETLRRSGLLRIENGDSDARVGAAVVEKPLIVEEH
jgi:hypothetical protein